MIQVWKKIKKSVMVLCINCYFICTRVCFLYVPGLVYLKISIYSPIQTNVPKCECIIQISYNTSIFCQEYDMKVYFPLRFVLELLKDTTYSLSFSNGFTLR